MVLDNDGVPIEVGDTVRRDEGSEYLVEEINRNGVLCYDGDTHYTFNPKFLSHTRPDSYEPPSGWNLPACCSEQDPTAPWNQPDAYTCCDCDQYDGATRDCGFCRFSYARLVEEADGKAPAPRDVSGCVVAWDQCVCGGFSEVQ